MSGYEIIVQCGEAYPQEAPAVTVRFANGSTFEPTVPWIPGVSNLLAQVTLAVIPQVKLPNDDVPSQPFSFNFDEE